MSARREKRLRRLERRVEALETKADVLSLRQDRTDIKMSNLRVIDADWAPAPPRRSLWRRLLDTIKGRDEP